jgi:putative membrane protein
MGPEHSFGVGLWIFIPIAMMVLCFFLFKSKVFGRGDFKRPWQQSSESSGGYGGSGTALEILKTRYAAGEITKDEFERMKQDLEA